MSVCSEMNCENKIQCRGLCRSHWGKRKEAGTLPPPNYRPSQGERFWNKVAEPDENGCWNWKAHIAAETGYGQFKPVGGAKLVNAHRYIYQAVVGEIPPGFLVDHRCHNRACVNPDHLRLVTRKQNSENMAGATRKSKSGVRGVWFVETSNRWAVQVRHNGRRYSGGQHLTLEAAESAAVALRNRLFTHNDVDRGLALLSTSR